MNASVVLNAASEARDPRLDALRALALLPVVTVNWLGYATQPDGLPFVPPVPLDSLPAQALTFLVSWLLQAKGLVLLTFLFAYSQSASFRRQADFPTAQTRRRTRLQKLLLLGGLHGTFIYFGDILTAYAIAGWGLLHWAQLRPRGLWRRAWGWGAASVALTVLMLWWLGGGAAADDPNMDLRHAVSHYGAWWSVNAQLYLFNVIGTLVMLPDFLAVMALGALAGRLRVLQHARWSALRARCARSWPGVLGLGAVLSAWQVWAWCAGDAELALRIGGFSWLVALLTVVVTVPHGLRWLAQWPQASQVLAAMGRRSLSVYLLSSVLSLAVFSGWGAGWHASTTQVVGVALVFWSLALALCWRARAAASGPLERWLARPW